MTTVLAAWLLAAAQATPAPAPPPAEASRTWVALDAPRVEVTLALRHAASPRASHWRLAVAVDGATAHVHEDSTEHLEAAFHAPGFMDGCTPGEDCRRAWLEDELPGSVQVHLAPPMALADWQDRALQGQLEAHFAGRDCHPAEAHLAEMRALLGAGFVSMGYALSPVQPSASFAWLPSHREFVPYWDD